jgi:hypothetical protein
MSRNIIFIFTFPLRCLACFRSESSHGNLLFIQVVVVFLSPSTQIITLLLLLLLLLWPYSPLLGLGLLFSYLILYIVGRITWTGEQPVARPLPTHRINVHNTDIHALSGIRTHDPSVQASEVSSCLRPRGHCNRPVIT